MKKILTVACCLVLMFSFAGCSIFQDKPEKTAPELAKEGREYFADENYNKAIDAYKRLKDWYPYSQHAKEAELRIADSHFELKEYEEALFAYEQYEQLHPSDSKIPYVIYQMGRSYYDRMRGIDRTQVPAQKALDAFERLRSRFPQSEYAEKAEPLMKEIRRNMAGHEFYIGKFYFKAGQYRAALQRFEDVLHNYPGISDYEDEARHLIAEAKEHLQNMENGEEETPEPPAESEVPVERDGPDPVL